MDPPHFPSAPRRASERASEQQLQMKESDPLPTLSTAPAATATKTTETSSSSSLFGKGRYKFWALAAIALLAFWSMLTGTVSLRSSGDLSSDDLLLLSQQPHADLDILEVEEREEVVRRKWEVYSSQSRRVRLPRFWEEAFEAAYEELADEDAEVREAAVSEIAKMSMRMLGADTTARYSENVGRKNRRIVAGKSATSSSVQVQ